MVSDLEEPDGILFIKMKFFLIALLGVSYKFQSKHMIRRLNIIKFIYI